MRNSLTRLIALVATPALLGLVPVAAAAAQATLSCPAMAQAGQQFVTELTIDVGPTTALGAYSVTLTYDPALVTVASVAGGNTTEFSGTPTTNTPTPGTTNIAAFQSSSFDSPKGVVSVALITFNVVATASATASIGLTVNHLYDTNSTPITPATGTGCAVSVTNPASTTTSTTTSTLVTSTTTLPMTTTSSTTTTSTRPPTTTSSVTTSTTSITSTTTTSTLVTSTTTLPMTTTSSTTTSTRPPTTTSSVTTTTTRALVTTTVTAPPTSTTLITLLPLSACPDADAAAAVQSTVDRECNCLGAKNHGAYVRCAARLAKAAVKTGALPRACRRAVKVCAARSICGRPGFVTCCRTNGKGATKCSIKGSAAACKAPKGGQACVGQRPSCCGACTGGGCALPGVLPPPGG